MNDLVVLSLNLAQQAIIGPTAVLPSNFVNDPSNGFTGSGQNQQQQLRPPATAPALINPNINYPQLIGGASGFNPFFGAAGPDAVPNPEPVRGPLPSAYEAVSAIYDSVEHIGEPTRGTQVSFEV